MYVQMMEKRESDLHFVVLSVLGFREMRVLLKLDELRGYLTVSFRSICELMMLIA
jgi:hypothetical protein